MKDKVKQAYNEMLNEVKGPNAVSDLKWLRRHIDGFNVRLTALSGIDAAYLFNKNHKKIQRIAKDVKSVHDELKTAILEEMADEKMRERSR